MALRCSFLLLLSLLSLTTFLANASDPELNVYIVFVDSQSRPAKFSTPEQWYTNLLDIVTGEKRTQVGGGVAKSDRLVYVYNTLNGFAAKLSAEEAAKLSKFPEVFGINISRNLHIDRSGPAY